MSRMSTLKPPTLLVVLLALSALWPRGAVSQEGADAAKAEIYAYDSADETIVPTMLGEKDQYDSAVLAVDEGVWVAWLEFVPGRGDHVWVGLREGEAWKQKECATKQHGKYARPTLTRDSVGRTWLSYEAERVPDRQWDVMLSLREGDGRYSPARRVSGNPGADISHRVTADSRGGLWFVWQSDRNGQFDVLARYVGGEDWKTLPAGPTHVVSVSERGDWCPAVAPVAGGRGCVVLWDSYDGESFNVLGRACIDGQWKPVFTVAGGPAFQARPDVVCDARGRVWVLWEEGALNWGKAFRSKGPTWNNVTDVYGPLHRFRKLRVAVLQPRGKVRPLAEPLPMPGFARAAAHPKRREAAKELGVYYERGRLSVDGSGRLWVVYRHFRESQLSLSEPTKHHVETGWKTYARCLEGAGWSPLYGFERHQRDGTQRLSVSPTKTGFAAVWTTGRTDRKVDPEPRGVAWARVARTGGAASEPELEGPVEQAGLGTKVAWPAPLAPAEVGGRAYGVYMGDLHRHTDLSLCFPFYDGSIDDAYRYAVDVASLDFLGVTDHTRDIARGEVLSQLWWRCLKDVTRHRLRGVFFPYFSYERSHADTDHNVISLRDDMLRNFPPPLPEFWDEIVDHDTFTIPHTVAPRTWEYQDDEKRPLMEVYQGFRDNVDHFQQAHGGLDRGYHFGFIASSDHLSASASYACVWSPERSREAIFRSMQARRTYGATDRIRLVFRSGEHWMGERFACAGVPEFQIEIDGTAPIASLEVYQDGKPVASLPVPGGEASIRTTYRPEGDFSGSHYLYVHMKQTDGNQAWSSPIWVEGGGGER